MKFLGFQRVFEDSDFRPLATLGVTGGGLGQGNRVLISQNVILMTF